MGWDGGAGAPRPMQLIDYFMLLYKGGQQRAVALVNFWLAVQTTCKAFFKQLVGMLMQ